MKAPLLALLLVTVSATALAEERAPQEPRPQGPPPRDTRPGGPPRRYSIEQATSDRAQLHTIAFDGLAFLTGDFALDTFLPPGKVSDYFGFQYMRDVDAAEGGHNTSFLTRIASNVLTILDEGQRARLLALAREQEADLRRFAEMRFPLIRAFRRNLEGDLPAGSQGLDLNAVRKASADPGPTASRIRETISTGSRIRFA